MEETQPDMTSTADTELQRPQLLVTASTAPPVNASSGQTTKEPAVEVRSSESTSGLEVVSAQGSTADPSNELPQVTLATSTETSGHLKIRLRLPTAADTAAASANAKGTSFCPIATGLTRSFISRHGWNGSIKQKETHRNSSVGEGHGASHGKHCPVSVSGVPMPHSRHLIVFHSAICGRDWKDKNTEGTKGEFDTYFKNLSADQLQVPSSRSFNITTTLMFIFSALQGRGEG